MIRHGKQEAVETSNFKYLMIGMFAGGLIVACTMSLCLAWALNP